MKDHRAVSRYAKALFELAGERQELETLDRDFLHVRQLVEQHPEITHLVSNSTLALTEKEDFLEKIMPSETSKTLVCFLKVLMKKRRFKELPLIQEEFRRAFEKKRGIQEVKVVAADRLSPANEEKLRRVLNRKLKAEIRLVAEIDPDLIGGLILRFDGTEMNASFKGRLEQMRQRLTA